MANLDIIHIEDSTNEDGSGSKDSELISWVMERVQDWERHRETNYRKKWNEYYRLWRGIWDAADKQRDTERSRIIAPALSQAVEATVAELEEATFGGGKWFDVDDNVGDENKTDIGMFRDQLKEDLEDAGVPAAMSEIFMNGCIYGTGIGKIVVEETTEATIVASPINDSSITEAGLDRNNKVQISLVAVHPQEFVIDPSARTIDDALGMAHITVVPRHIVAKKQDDGMYTEGSLGDFSDTLVGNKTLEKQFLDKNNRHRDSTLIIEYHGLVPRELIPLDLEEDEEQIELFPDNDTPHELSDEYDLVESVITIANGSMLLRAIRNPLIMEDRAFIAYPHDKIPNEFWGRGVCEKGYNSQKALDSEMRGRIDAMAISIHPMMGMDATRLARGQKYKIGPGKTILTVGDPNNVLRPFQFGQVNQSTFSQSGELERMVQMATGAMDSATPIGENRRNETSSGMSMIMSGAIKRSKRTLANIERLFTKPLIHKAAWRFMQFAPDRYPAVDAKFKVIATLGLVARELEMQNMSNMMNSVPPESPAFWMLLKGVYENSSLSNREEMLPIIDQMMQKSIEAQSKPPEPDPMIAIKQQELQLKGQIEQAKLQMEGQENQQEAQHALSLLELDWQRLQLKREEMILKAQIALAAQEQDSMVTAVQMQHKHDEATQKADEKKESSLKEAATKAPAPQPVIVQTGEVTNVSGMGGGDKTISIKRTKAGLEGSVTSKEGGKDNIITINKPKPERNMKIKIKRTKDGLEGTVDG